VVDSSIARRDRIGVRCRKVRVAGVITFQAWRRVLLK
jgi:hypothetical protein